MQKWLSTARNRQNEKIVFNLIIELSETITMKSSEIRGDGVLISQATAMKKVSHVLKSALKSGFCTKKSKSISLIICSIIF